MKASSLEKLLISHMVALKLPEYQAEYRFDAFRRWRFDFAWPDLKLAVEVEGGTWAGGRHTTGSGFEKDCEKYNSAAAQGWTVLRYTGGLIKSGAAIQQIEAVLNEII